MESIEFCLGPLPLGAGVFLTDQLAALLTDRPDAGVVVCDVSAVEQPRAVDLDHLARLRLTAQRAGRTLVLRGVGPRLRLLLVLAGLDEVFGAQAGGLWAPDGAGGQPPGKSW
ncbi:STAS domain-containing protein [Streptomyces sp. NPDC086766]|uniref:STAS domain-containing protein n=1 Tax=Streptomyces sp. NPDC086766 TaxID=3365754 RepID=UPI00381F2449